MKPHTRACIAYIAGCIISKETAASIHDQTQGIDIRFSRTFSIDSVEISDLDSLCHILGMKNGNEVSLYHSEDQHKISLKISGDQFSGQEFGSNCGFNGMVNGKSVRV